MELIIHATLITTLLQNSSGSYFVPCKLLRRTTKKKKKALADAFMTCLHFWPYLLEVIRLEGS